MVRVARADDLGDRRQIEARHTVLEEIDAIEIEQPCRHGSEGCKQKGSSPVRRFPAEVPIQIRPDRDVEHAIGAESAAQLIDQMLLRASDLARGTVADQRDLLAERDQFLDRARQGIQTAGEQDHLVRREAHDIRVRKLEIGRCGRRIAEQQELELVVVVREETQRLDER